MKKKLVNLTLSLGLMLMLTSCYTYTHTVGTGPQSGTEVKKMNHYLIYGLAPINVSNPTELAEGAQNYEVTVQHTFVDGLIQILTLGIYTPTTTVVKK